MKPSDKKEAEGDRRGTFLTGVNELIAKSNQMADTKMQPVDNLHKALCTEVEHANEYMNTVINSYQDDMLLAYRLEMQNVYKDYRALNEKLEKVKEECRNNEELKKVKDELEWFRDEALKLHDKSEEQKEMIQRMKNTLDILEEDKKYFQQQLIKSKRVGKQLNQQLKEYAMKYPEFRVNEEIGALDEDPYALSFLTNFVFC